MKSFFITLLLLALLTFPTIANAQDTEAPDLVITNVAYSIAPPIRTPLSRSSGSSSTLFKVTIMNVGDADFGNQLFYLSLASTEEDITSGHYSTIAGVSAKSIVSPGESFEVEISGPPLYQLKQSHARVKFLIQTDGKPHLKDALPKIQEKSYDNNTYEITING